MRPFAAALAALAVLVLPARASAPGGSALTLIALVDVSASMTLIGLPEDPRVETLVKAIGETLRAGDRVRIGRLAGQAAFSDGFASGGREIRRAARVLDVPMAERHGPSPLWDGLDAAVRLLEREPDPRAVIVWTDGHASGNRLTRHDVVRRALAAGVPIHVVSAAREMTIRQSETTAAVIRPAVYLEWVARQTGGMYVSEHLSGPMRLRGDPGPAVRYILEQMVRPDR
jgi:hypothetical protein